MYTYAQFREWALDNFGNEGSYDFNELMDHYVQSGEFPEQFIDDMEFEKFQKDQKSLARHLADFDSGSVSSI